MENYFSTTDELEKINESSSTNNEFYQNLSNPIEDWEDEDYDLQESKNLQEIELYDYEKTQDENFEDGKSKKYMLIEVNSNGSMLFSNTIPTPQSKIVVDMSKIDQYGTLETLIVDYDSIFGTRFITFMKYNSNFFVCDERVVFEALLIKFKAFGYKPFFWSKNMIFKEAGIKKDRATKIIKRFTELGIIKSAEIVKSKIDNRPQQITYYNLDSDKIVELLPQIFKGREDECDMENQIHQYLYPSTKKTSKIQ